MTDFCSRFQQERSATLSRSIKLYGTVTLRTGSPAICRFSMLTASALIRPISWRMVVCGGVRQQEMPESSLAMREMSCGTRSRKSRSAWAQLIKTESDIEQPILGVNEQELQKKRRLAGYAAMVYAEPGPEPQASDSDEGKAQSTKKTKAPETDDDKMPYPLAATYKKLTEIEACFRIMKSHLGLRPMFVRNSNHIRGHITVCFLALLLIRIIQERLAKGGSALSIAEITRTLRTAQVVPTKQENGYYYLSLGNRHALRSEDPWASTADLIKKLQKGEVQGQDQLNLVMKACGLDVPPVLCSRVELGQALGTRFASDRDILSPLEWYLQNGEAPSPQDSPPAVAAG